MEDSQISAALSAELAARIGAQRYELWFGPTTRLCVLPDRLEVIAPSVFVRDWLRRNFADDLRASCETVFGRSVAMEFTADESNHGRGALQQVALTRSAGTQAALRSSPAGKNGCRAETPAANNRPAAEFSLAAFQVGPSNEYAFRTAELTAHGRQQASPVLWCGPTGVGKTHLLRAIVGEYRRRHPRARVVYLTAEQFTTGFLEALRGSGLPSFRQKCRGAELLAIDDLQFFAGKARTIEELQHTVDTLLTEGRQLVAACDRSLSEMRALGPELVSRLAGGLVCEIEPPEYATRLAIVRRLSRELRLEIEDEVLSRVAGRITGGARELRGALHRLQAVSTADGRPITSELVEQALRELARQTTRCVRLSDVEQAVCDVFGVEPAQLRSERKARSVSEPRMLAMWLARKYTRVPWSEIGQFFGRRSHSTVIAAHRRVERMIHGCGEVAIEDRSCRVDEAIRRLERALRTA